MFSEQELAHAQIVLEKIRGEWMQRPGVTAVDLGFKWSAGAMTNRLAIRVHVAQKRPIADLTPAELFPREVEGIDVDVIEATYGLQLMQNEEDVQLERAIDGRDNTFSPIPLGVSIGNPYVTAGTLGAKVLDNATNAEMILSNWHILVGDPDAASGTPIWQPGRLDGGGSSDKFAELSRWVLGPHDAAVATLTGARPVLTATLEGRAITTAARPQLGMRVWKSGRTTGLTEGFIDGINMTTSLYYGRAGTQIIRDAFRIVPLPGSSSDTEVSQGGDSGSVWVDSASGSAVGLHFAGESGNAPEHALANDIMLVIQRLAVHFPGADAPGDGIADGDNATGSQPLSWWQLLVQFLRRLFGLD